MLISSKLEAHLWNDLPLTHPPIKLVLVEWREELIIVEVWWSRGSFPGRAFGGAIEIKREGFWKGDEGFKKETKRAKQRFTSTPNLGLDCPNQENKNEEIKKERKQE